MSNDEHAERTESDEKTESEENSEQSDQKTESGENSEQSDSPVDEETLKEAEEKVTSVEQRYRPGARPTVVVEGTDGTVAGTAFASDEDIEKHQSEQDDEDE